MSRSAGASTVALAVVVSLGVGLAWAAEDEVRRGVVDPLAPATNRTTDAKIELGEKLFTDQRLSVDGDMACATCHLASLAFTDGKALAVGRGGKRLGRNAPTLMNVGLVRDLFHDGRAPSLEEQARAVLLNPDELGWPDAAEFATHVGAIEEYGPLFEAAFGDRTVTLQRTVRALAAFERTLVGGDAPFDRWWNGNDEALTESQQRGYRVFIGPGGCVQCHSIRQSYATFSDGRFHNTGAGKGDGKTDPGRGKISGAAEDQGAFRTPTLRNVTLTGPFMHDGSLATLPEVVDFYVDGGGENANLSPLIRPLELDEEDRTDLVAFLESLTSSAIPRLDECEKALAAGRPEEALAIAERQLTDEPANDALIDVLARVGLALDRAPVLHDAEARLRTRVRALSPDHERDGDATVARHLILLGEVSAALTRHEDAMAVARAEDAILAWRRARVAADGDRGTRDEALLLEAQWTETRGRKDLAVEILETRSAEPGAPANVREALAGHVYRRGWRLYVDGTPGEQGPADMRRAAELLDALSAEGATLCDDSRLFRAYARHYPGEIAAARAAYADAAQAESVAERALSGLRSLMSADLDAYRTELEQLATARPDSPALLYHLGYERLQQGRLDDAETALRRRIEVEETASAGPHVYLAQVHARRGERDEAVGAYTVALALDPGFRGLVAEFEAYIRGRELDGFEAVDALVADYDLFLKANSDDRRFQCLARNNLAFLLREVAASFTSRGAARMHTFPDGAPDDARRILDTCLRTYREALALVPDDVEDLPFEERWVYAGVFNDTGLMLHYFVDLQDFAEAEKHYLRAFELTGGAYQDAYFYNLQFLYGFELNGRESEWLELAEIAKDAILKEDPASRTGFSPDRVKRRAALRDFQRLSSTLRR